jgi:trehalose-6-phosphatase
MHKSKMTVRELTERASSAESVLLVMNIDGMVPVASEMMPHRSHRPLWLEEAEPALLRLERLPGMSLGVVTGEGYGELCGQTKRHRQLWRIAEHGAVVGMPGGGCLVEPSASALEVLASLAGEGNGGAVRVEGVLLDGGGATTGVAIHSLAVKERGRASVLSALINMSCRGRALGMKLVSGRLVVEAGRKEHRVADALERVLEELPEEVLPIYAGCGPSDKPAMALTRSRGGIRVAVGGAEKCPADVVVPSIDAWVEALWTIAEARMSRPVAEAAGWGEALPA